MFGKGTLMLIAAISVAGIFASFGIGNNLVETEARLAEDEFEILARNAALAGLNRMEQHLSDKVYGAGTAFDISMVDQDSLDGTYDNIGYGAKIEQIGTSNRVRVWSKGTAETARGTQVDFDVQSEYEIIISGGGGPGGEGVPVAMQEAVTSQCGIDLGGSLLIDSPNGKNANVRTNQSLSVRGNGWTVHGYGYMANNPNSLSNGDRKKLENNLNPYDAVNAGTLVQVDPLEEEVFDAVYAVRDYYHQRADYCVGCDPQTAIGTVVEGLGDIDTEAITPTYQNPLVIIVNGDLHLNGGSYPAYTIFLVNGDLRINGNFNAGASNNDDKFLSTLAFYIEGDVRMNGNATVWGQFFTRGDFDLGNGTATINGSITSLCEDSDGNISGSTELRGNFTINYYGANPYLSGAELPQIALKRRNHSEW